MRPLTFALMLLIALVSLAAMAAVAGWMGYGPFGGDRSRPVTASVSGNVLRIDQNYLRVAEQRNGGEQDHVDLVARFPDFLPARSVSAAGAIRDVDEARQVVVTLAAPDDVVDPADRPSKLYARFLSPDVWSHPGGLVMRRFEAGTPYDSEELYLAPPEGRAFSARCMRPGHKPDGLPDSCIADFRMSGLDVRIRFQPDLLPEWQSLIEGVRGLVRSILVTP